MNGRRYLSGLSRSGSLSAAQAVIFDLDGTLVDSVSDVTSAINLVLAEQARSPLSPEIVRLMIGDGIQTLIDRVLTATSSSPVKNGLVRAQCENRYKYFYAIHSVDDTVLYDGVPEVLSILQTIGYRLGLCTNKPHDITLRVLEAMNIRHHFAAVVGSGCTPFRKPDARPLQEVMMQLGTDRTACVYIGDSEVDVATAKNADVPFILVTYGYARGLAAELEVSEKVDSFRVLPEIIDRFLPRSAK